MKEKNRCRDCIYCYNIHCTKKHPLRDTEWVNFCNSDYTEYIWCSGSSEIYHLNKDGNYQETYTDFKNKGSCFKPKFEYLMRKAIRRGKNGK